ncbi:MAG: hypothetical protein K2P94_01465 [Rhodospirillaceae bacterium]|nr:hypothetical protein [Rhodospirillaceae bacterium]
MPEKDTISTTPKPLVSAVKRLLRPVVRLLISKGMGLPALTEVLKEVYVDVALREFPTRGKKQTDSSISILTGVHRKDVKRLRTKKDRGPQAPRSVSIGAQLVARWVGSRETTDKKGRPLPLPRQAESAGGPSFDALVAGVSTDVRPRAVLDEWLRLGIAHLDADERVVLNQLAFVPQKGFEEKAFYLGRNIHDHVAAAAHNLLGEGNPQLERSVHYSGLTSESAKALAAASERVGMEALLEINRLALQLISQDKGNENATRRINFGLYFYKGAATTSSLQIETESEDSET